MNSYFYELYHRFILKAKKLKRRHQYFRPPVMEIEDYINARPFNHYESPYPDIREVHKNEDKLFDRSREILDVDLNLNRQLELLDKMKKIRLPAWKSRAQKDSKGYRYRYYYDNGWFDQGSADALFYMINIIKPQTIIEVGSGFSTAVMLDTNENYFHNKIKIYSIEPRAERLRGLLKPADNLEIFEKDMQDMPVEFFEQLKENDILFIDSSHVAKVFSDVNYLFFEILPRLRGGVYVHFHDIFYPFLYPEQWIYEGRAYNEMYLLRAFLMNNEKYRIQFWGDMLKHRYPDKISEKLERCGTDCIWIKKI